MQNKTSQSIFLHTIHGIGLRVETGVVLERKMWQTPRFTGINEFGTVPKDTRENVCASFLSVLFLVFRNN